MILRKSPDIVCVDLHTLQVLVVLLVDLRLVVLPRSLAHIARSIGWNMVGPLGIDDPTGTTGLSLVVIVTVD